jgi:hypothetical protein
MLLNIFKNQKGTLKEEFYFTYFRTISIFCEV